MFEFFSKAYRNKFVHRRHKRRFYSANDGNLCAQIFAQPMIDYREPIYRLKLSNERLLPLKIIFNQAILFLLFLCLKAIVCL